MHGPESCIQIFGASPFVLSLYGYRNFADHCGSLGARFPKRLAHISADCFCYLVSARLEFAGIRLQYTGALILRHSRPAGKSSLSTFDGILYVLFVSRRTVPNDIPRRWAIVLKGQTIAGAPLSVNKNRISHN